MNYIKQRLSEPGSIRSLAVILFALKAFIPERWGISLLSVDDAQNLINALIAILGGYSFLKPDAATKAADKVQDAVQDVTAKIEDLAADKIRPLR